MWRNILDRFIVHFFSAASVYLLVFFLIKRAQRWRYWEITVPALLALGFIGWREAWDVAHGQAFVKAVTDWISWGAGLAAAIWGLLRWQKATRT